MSIFSQATNNLWCASEFKESFKKCKNKIYDILEDIYYESLMTKDIDLKIGLYCKKLLDQIIKCATNFVNKFQIIITPKGNISLISNYYSNKFKYLQYIVDCYSIKYEKKREEIEIKFIHGEDKIEMYLKNCKDLYKHNKQLLKKDITLQINKEINIVINLLIKLIIWKKIQLIPGRLFTYTTADKSETIREKNNLNIKFDLEEVKYDGGNLTYFPDLIKDDKEILVEKGTFDFLDTS